MTEPNNKWIYKVEALLRKAEDPATTEEERENLVDKVTYLMTKFGIEQDMLNFELRKPLMAEHRTIKIISTYPAQRLLIAHAIAIAFGCRGVKTDTNKVDIFGTRDDIERTYMLYMSLMVQLDVAMAQAKKLKPSYEHGRTFNGSFVSGFVVTVTKRIHDAAARAKQDIKESTMGSGMELVLVNKAQVVHNLLRDIYPRLTTVRTSLSTNSQAGYGAGVSAGQQADIGGTRISSQHADRRAISG